MTEPPDGHFSNPDDLKWVREQLKSGNDYAWFQAEVQVVLLDAGRYFEASDYLGGCSYQSVQDFTDDGGAGYYSDMVETACDASEASFRKYLSAGGRAAFTFWGSDPERRCAYEYPIPPIATADKIDSAFLAMLSHAWDDLPADFVVTNIHLILIDNDNND